MPPSNRLWGMQAVEVYASTTSVRAGEAISFHISVADASRAEPVHLAVYRSNQFDYGPENPFGRIAADIYASDYRSMLSVGAGEQPVHEVNLAAQAYPVPADAGRSGCGWPAADAWQVPDDLPPGVHLAEVTYGGDRSYALFVVRPLTAAAATTILCQLSSATHQAYNPWSGSCFYGPPICDTQVSQVSFARPCPLWDFLLYEQPIVSWLEQHYPVEFCTSIDVHADANLLNPYQLLISCGHDEYWSAAMRDRVDAFATAGGNVLILSGNTAFRPVEFDAELTTMTLSAGTWNDLGRPESATTGVRFSAGRWSQPLPPVGFTVRRPRHWVFAGTGLQAGDQFGHDEGVIGYETDAAPYDDATGFPLATGADGTSLGYAVLATADLTEAPQQWVDQPGHATLGYLRHGAGIVMAAATTGWGQGLLDDAGHVPAVTANMVDRLRHPTPMTNGALYALTAAGDLTFYRDHNQDGTGDITGGTVVGIGWDDVERLVGGGDGVLYAVTRDGALRMARDPNADGTGPVAVGQVISPSGWQQRLAVFGGDPGQLFAVTPDGNLVSYQVSDGHGGPTIDDGRVVGQGGWDQFRLLTAGGGGVIYGVDGAGNLALVQRDPLTGTAQAGAARVIGHAEWATANMLVGTRHGTLYVINEDGQLLWYEIDSGSGSVDVGPGQVVGRSGWNTFTALATG